MPEQYILTPYFMDELIPQLQPLLEPGWLIVQPGGGSPEDQIRSNIADIAEGVAGSVASGRRPVSIAGDCMSAIGVMGGLARAEIHPTVIWFDAHGDFNTPDTTPSGFLGGMPLAMLTGRGDLSFIDHVDLDALPDDRVILTDARDLDPGERNLVEKSGMTHLPDVADLLHADLPEGPLYIHFDADVLNPDDAPAHRYATPGGPSLDVMEDVFRRLANTGRVRAVSVSTWDARNDPVRKSQKAVMDLLDVLLG